MTIRPSKKLGNVAGNFDIPWKMHLKKENIQSLLENHKAEQMISEVFKTKCTFFHRFFFKILRFTFLQVYENLTSER